MEQEALVMCTVHIHPSDYPEHVVVREWQINAGEARPLDAHLFADVAAATEWLLSQGLTWIGRHPQDDNKIQSVWF